MGSKGRLCAICRRLFCFRCREVHVGQDDFECVIRGYDLRLSGRARVSSHDFPHSRAVCLDELQAVEDVGEMRVPAGGDAHHQVFQLQAGQKAADGHELDPVVVDADQRAGVEGVVPVYERIQQGLAHGDLRVVPGVDAQQLLESGMGLVVEVDVVVGLAELPHKGPGELPAVLEHALVRPLENGRLDGVRALVG